MRKVAVTPQLVGQVEADKRFRLALEEAVPRGDWRERALCISAPDPDLFFPAAPDEAEPARRLCRRCPTAGACLAEALNRAEVDGVWGGTTCSERRLMRPVWRRRRALSVGA